MMARTHRVTAVLTTAEFAAAKAAAEREAVSLPSLIRQLLAKRAKAWAADADQRDRVQLENKNSTARAASPKPKGATR